MERKQRKQATFSPVTVKYAHFRFSSIFLPSVFLFNSEFAFISAHLFSFSISSPVLNLMNTFSLLVLTVFCSLIMSTGSNSICYGFCRDIYLFKMADTFQPTLELKLCIVHVSTCRSEARAVKRTLRGALR